MTVLGSGMFRKLPKLVSFQRRSVSTQTYDIIIAGGGMVGAAMACSLGASPSFKNKSVLMLEAGSSVSSKQKDPNIYSNRVSAISPGSKKLFESLDVWASIEKNRLKPVKQLQVWDACSESKIHFERENFNGDVAYIIENDVIIDSCVETLEKLTNVTVKTNAAVKSCKLVENLSTLVEIELVDGSSYRSDLLIAADGANSLVRKTMGVHYVSWPYGQKGVVATLEVSSTGNNEIAWQRFTPNGPIALLPLTDRLSSLVWTTATTEAERLLALDDDRFVDSLNSSLRSDRDQSFATNKVLDFFENCVKFVVPASTTDARLMSPTVVRVLDKSRAAFPLGLGHATHYVLPRVVLIGDAAHRVHPLAGQGVNLGFGDVATLTQVLERCIGEGADIGSMMYLSEYESRRQRHNVPVMFTIDWLNRLYSSKRTPFVLARSLGLNLVDKMTPLKKMIIEEASI